MADIHLPSQGLSLTALLSRHIVLVLAREESSPMSWIDLRSDTVTQPTSAMREAMFQAELGDDVYGDDPTVKALEAAAAQRLGKEAALLVPTGNFGNQLAILTHCQRGDEVILGDDCHIVWHETGGAALIAGVQLRTISSEDGVLPVTQIAQRIRVGEDIHHPRTGLICLENAHSNGRLIPLEVMAETAALAKQHAIPIHLDGARIFNAAIALGCEPSQIAQYADSVMFCLSKGLAAPLGSILAGSAAFIQRARRYRKLMGGGMRQAGIIAAPGLVALQEMVERLREDHANARYLAENLAALPGISLEVNTVQINLVWFRIDERVDSTKLMAALTEAGIKANPPDQGLMRLVTHWQIQRADIDRLLAVFRQVISV